MAEIIAIQKAGNGNGNPQEPTQSQSKAKLSQPKITKERLAQKFHREIGGVISYWRAIPAEELRALNAVLEENPDAKAAISSLVAQIKTAKETNANLNRKNFGLTQTAAKHERVADRLTKANALLERQKNELLKQIRDLVGALTQYEDSEIRRGAIQVRNFISGLVR